MPWKTMEAEEQKVRFVVAATRGEKSLTPLCEGVWDLEARQGICGGGDIAKQGWA